MHHNIFADLHNHTQASDGDFSSQALVAKAREQGIKALGVTDHDTLGGLVAAVAAGDRAGVEVVPGVEISVRFTRSFFTGTLHVLAYFSRQRLMDKGFYRRFTTLLSEGRGDGLVYARIQKINRIFGPGGQSPLLERELTFEDIAAYSANASRRHFALALSRDLGMTDKKTINQIIGNDSPAYLPSGIELEKVGQFLKKEPVVAVLAHPAAGSFPEKGHYKEVLPPVETVEQLLPEFLSAGIQGLEVYYPGHSVEHRALLLDWTKRYDLLVTGGSDCHDASERPSGACGIGEVGFKKLKEAIGSRDMEV